MTEQPRYQQYTQDQHLPAQAQPYPPQAQAQPGYTQQPAQPMQVKHVGKAVTKPAWTIGDILWIFFTAGMAWPIIWLKRRARTTVTRYE